MNKPCFTHICILKIFEVILKHCVVKRKTIKILLRLQRNCDFSMAFVTLCAFPRATEHDDKTLCNELLLYLW